MEITERLISINLFISDNRRMMSLNEISCQKDRVENLGRIS